MATQDHTADGDEFTPAPRTLTTPQKIAGPLHLEASALQVCHETIDQFAYSKDGHPSRFGTSCGLSHLPFHARRSITFDRGVEFTTGLRVQAGLGVAVSFCDPEAPWQKGTNESDIAAVLASRHDRMALTDAFLSAICQRLHNTPGSASVARPLLKFPRIGLGRGGHPDLITRMREVA